jgi:DNA-binding CsgD family transcriptional regulator/alkylated DNA nucleotide flippase Atl1
MCHGALDQLPEPTALTPYALAALAGQLSHCATYGDDCAHEDRAKRQRCAAFAVHMHAAAAAAHKTHKASLFDHLPATWVLDRSAQVIEVNATAKALVQAGERVTMVGSTLELVGTGGARTLQRAVAQVTTQKRLPWKDVKGNDVSFLLRALPGGKHVAVTALLDAPSAAQRAPQLAEQLGLTPRQSELAAHLLADQTLVGAARAMGISRHTANEHLVALLQRTGAPDRKALLVMLRRIATR